MTVIDPDQEAQREGDDRDRDREIVMPKKIAMIQKDREVENLEMTMNKLIKRLLKY